MTDGNTRPAASTDTAWEDPPRRAPAGQSPVLSVDGFEGPIDFLVEQSRAGRIDLARLSIAALVDAFSDALAVMLEGPDKRLATLSRWGAWLVMAADLALLRSRLMLPAAGEAEMLGQRVQLRAGIAAAADWLERQDQLGRDTWSRGQPEITRQAAGRAGDITGLFRACLVALRVPDAVEESFRFLVPRWSVPDATARIRAMLPQVGEGASRFEALLPEVPPGGMDYALRCRAAVASTFSAGLHMAQEGSIAIEQTTDCHRTIMVARTASGGVAQASPSLTEHSR